MSLDEEQNGSKSSENIADKRLPRESTVVNRFTCLEALEAEQQLNLTKLEETKKSYLELEQAVVNKLYKVIILMVDMRIKQKYTDSAATVKDQLLTALAKYLGVWGRPAREHSD